MRFLAGALAVVLAAFVTSGVTPTLSGMQVSAPCEVAPQSSSPLRAPTNLRIISAIGFEGLSARGPNSGPEMALPARAQGGGNPHAYYVALTSRPDCFAAYSLRDVAQIARYGPKREPPQLSYSYPNDSDPRRQDAMKLLIREGDIGIYGTLRVPIGPNRGQNLLFTLDVWFGNEFKQDHSRLFNFKEAPISFYAAGIEGWVGMRTGFALAQERTHNQPPGGPYVAMTIPQALGKGAVVKTPDTWMSGARGFPRVEMPPEAPKGQQRYYGETIAPMEAEFGIVGERWTRYWHFFERRPSEDWVSDHPDKRFNGKLISAYAYSLWAADTVRDPVRMLDERIVGIPAEYPDQIVAARFSYNPGNIANPSRELPGRGDLVNYQRNWVVLHGTSKADVLALLKKPVGN